jgi:hypothetical protein
MEKEKRMNSRRRWPTTSKTCKEEQNNKITMKETPRTKMKEMKKTTKKEVPIKPTIQKKKNPRQRTKLVHHHLL